MSVSLRMYLSNHERSARPSTGSGRAVMETPIQLLTGAHRD
jgi:hypothetical protein